MARIIPKKLHGELLPFALECASESLDLKQIGPSLVHTANRAGLLVLRPARPVADRGAAARRRGAAARAVALHGVRRARRAAPPARHRARLIARSTRGATATLVAMATRKCGRLTPSSPSNSALVSHGTTFAHMGAIVRPLTVVLALSLLGCGPKTGTSLDPIAPQTAVVGVELGVMLRAASAGHVDFAFESDSRSPQRQLHADADAVRQRRGDVPLDAARLRPRRAHCSTSAPPSTACPASRDGRHRRRRRRQPDLVPLAGGRGHHARSRRAPRAPSCRCSSTTPAPPRSTSTRRRHAARRRDHHARRPALGPAALLPVEDAGAGADDLSRSPSSPPTSGGARTEKRYTIVLGILAPPVVSPSPESGSESQSESESDAVADLRHRRAGD